MPAQKSKQLKPGDSVRLQRRVAKADGLKGRRVIARVLCRLPDIEGGVKLDKALDGFLHCWNGEDLELLA